MVKIVIEGTSNKAIGFNLLIYVQVSYLQRKSQRVGRQYEIVGGMSFNSIFHCIVKYFRIFSNVALILFIIEQFSIAGDLNCVYL